ncbi:MAG: TnsA endonuclease N-terminal domain-containing protein [Sphingobacteriales bacterium]|nr:TnsA endonuclease N-terminal domain-containing protein [Sphingobacteriales bacterium]OJW00168.1 MAG: hypothetical protein BGO52_03515 [Sphingobacteriales bacterium 44-61]
MSAKQPFKYGVSHKIIYWGCLFDSLLELKYAISIEQEYEFLRAHIPVYYDPKTLLPTDYIRGNIRRYTPDFLIRHKQTGEAFWVEVKPRAFAGDPQLTTRQKVAENYIRWKNYDWKYIVVFDDEIKLKEEQNQLFLHSRKLICKSARKLSFQQFNNQFDRSAPTFFSNIPRNAQIHFVMFGSALSSSKLKHKTP